MVDDEEDAATASINGDGSEEDRTHLLLENVADACSNEMLRLYILFITSGTTTLAAATTTDESLRIEDMRRNRRRALVRFSGTFDFDAVVERQARHMPELCGQVVRVSRVFSTNVVRVTELPNNCGKEMLMLYFTNERASSGGDVRSIKWFVFESMALVEFESARIVERVLARTHTLCEQQIRVQKYYEPIEDELRSGSGSGSGGDGEDADATGDEDEERDNGRNAQPKQQQQQQQRQQMTNNNASTSRLNRGNSLLKRSTSGHIGPRVHVENRDALVDKTKLVLSNIQDNVNIQQLEFYIGLLTNKSDIGECSWSMEHRGKLMIHFKKEIDINKTIFEFGHSMNNLNGIPVQLELLNYTRTIVVLVRDTRPLGGGNNKSSVYEIDLDANGKDLDDDANYRYYLNTHTVVP